MSPVQTGTIATAETDILPQRAADARTPSEKIWLGQEPGSGSGTWLTQNIASVHGHHVWRRVCQGGTLQVLWQGDQ
jgi:hypothetical protein